MEQQEQTTEVAPQPEALIKGNIKNGQCDHTALCLHARKHKGPCWFPDGSAAESGKDSLDRRPICSAQMANDGRAAGIVRPAVVGSGALASSRCRVSTAQLANDRCPAGQLHAPALESGEVPFGRDSLPAAEMADHGCAT